MTTEAAPAPAGVAGGGWTGLAGRCRAVPGVIRARWMVRQAERAERRALAALGDAFAGGTAPRDRAVTPGVAEIAHLDDRRDALRSSLDGSLAQDRADFADVAPWLRPLVVARGLATRAILRHRLRRLHRVRQAACLRLGASVADGAVDLPAGASHPVKSVAEARQRRAAAAQEEERLLAPAGGRLMPAPARLAAREAATFGRFTVAEARARLVPRLPALLGLVAGWWVTHTFTDSHFLATLHSIGIGSGPRRAVDPGTLRFLNFALPLVAAASCSYLSSRIAALVRARYGPASAAVGAESSPAPGRIA